MTESTKRVIFTMGGQGGVGKTRVVVALAEWFAVHEIPVTLLDLDTENKARGSLNYFFDRSVTKVNIHTPAGLDAFVDYLDSEIPILLADMDAFAPTILQMEFRLAELENPLRQHGVQLGQVAERRTAVDELKHASLVMRAQSYRRHLFAQFDKTRETFLP